MRPCSCTAVLLDPSTTGGWVHAWRAGTRLFAGEVVELLWCLFRGAAAMSHTDCSIFLTMRMGCSWCDDAGKA
jgi:hypothetical protein